MESPHAAEDKRDTPRRPPRDLIEAIVQSMRENLEVLMFSTLAPSRYVVYLHPQEYARLEGIIPQIRGEAVRALDEALDELNRRPVLHRYKDRLTGTARPRVENAGTAWEVDLVADADESLEVGDILVETVLLLPASPELGAGARTRRIATHHRTGPQMSNPVRTCLSERIFGRLVYEDEGGDHAHEIVKDSVTIGRGGAAYFVDVRIASSPDVSREHARIRRDPATAEFYLIDLSSLGTTLNGRPIPRGYDEMDGAKRENGAETRLPDRARIGLADTVFLEFRVERS